MKLYQLTDKQEHSACGALVLNYYELTFKTVQDKIILADSKKSYASYDQGVLMYGAGI